MSDNAPLVMAEEYWADSMLSIVRHTGMIKVFGHDYIIVDKEGRDVFELSEIAQKEGKKR